MTRDNLELYRGELKTEYGRDLGWNAPSTETPLPAWAEQVGNDVLRWVDPRLKLYIEAFKQQSNQGLTYHSLALGAPKDLPTNWRFLWQGPKRVNFNRIVTSPPSCIYEEDPDSDPEWERYMEFSPPSIGKFMDLRWTNIETIDLTQDPRVLSQSALLRPAYLYRNWDLKNPYRDYSVASEDLTRLIFSFVLQDAINFLTQQVHKQGLDMILSERYQRLLTSLKKASSPT